MPVVDQFNDPAFGTLYQQVQRMPGLEAFVKDASVESREAEALPASAFAWPEERRFPIHTPEHAALSYAYSKVASVLPATVTSSIQEALDVYGVKPDVFTETKTAAVEDTDYLLPDLHLFRVKTAADVRHAQNELLREITKLDLDHRAMACANLVKAAGAHDVELNPAMLKFAGFVVSSTLRTRSWLEARALIAPNEIHRMGYQKLADGLKTAADESVDREGLLKLASTIAILDEQSGLDRHYDRRLPDALQTVFNTEKRAASSVDVCGTMVPSKDLARLPASFWEDLGGRELSDEIAPGGVVDASKMATVVDTLPLDLKLVLKRQLRV